MEGTVARQSEKKRCQQGIRELRALHQGSRDKMREGLTVAKIRQHNGYEMRERAGERGLIEPPTIVRHYQEVRVREAEASNRSPRKKEAHHQQGGDEREQEGKVGSDRVCRGMEVSGRRKETKAHLL